MVNWVKTNSLE